jgi:DNA-binding protein
MTNAKRKKETAAKEKPAEDAKTAKNVEVKESIVFIGQKPVKNYVLACLTYFSSGANKIVIKARGRAICRAVDTVELLRRAFMKDLQLQGISICTEEVDREGGRKANVSAVEISVTKP